MGMFDSVYIEEHQCPKCGEMVDGELQTKDLGCDLSHWKFPDYIPDVDVEEVRKISLLDYCNNCRWNACWIGYIRNSVLYKLVSPSGEIREIDLGDALRDALAEVQLVKQESHQRRSLARSFAVFIWKFHPDKRDVLLAILKGKLGLEKEDFEKYTVSSCLNPLHRAFGIIGGPQTDYWRLEGKPEEQKEAESNFVRDAMGLPAGSPERCAVVDALDIEELMAK